MNLDKLDLRALLKEERIKRGMTYENVANGVGCSVSYVYRVEKGSRKAPSFSMVQKIIDFFELSEAEVLKYQEGVSERQMKKASIISQIEEVDFDSFKNVMRLLQEIDDYQKLIQLEKEKEEIENESCEIQKPIILHGQK